MKQNGTDCKRKKQMRQELCRIVGAERIGFMQSFFSNLLTQMASPSNLHNDLA